MGSVACSCGRFFGYRSNSVVCLVFFSMTTSRKRTRAAVAGSRKGSGRGGRAATSVVASRPSTRANQDPAEQARRLPDRVGRGVNTSREVFSVEPVLSSSSRARAQVLSRSSSAAPSSAGSGQAMSSAEAAARSAVGSRRSLSQVRAPFVSSSVVGARPRSSSVDARPRSSSVDVARVSPVADGVAHPAAASVSADPQGRQVHPRVDQSVSDVSIVAHVEHDQPGSVSDFEDQASDAVMERDADFWHNAFDRQTELNAILQRNVQGVSRPSDSQSRQQDPRGGVVFPSHSAQARGVGFGGGVSGVGPGVGPVGNQRVRAPAGFVPMHSASGFSSTPAFRPMPPAFGEVAPGGNVGAFQGAFPQMPATNPVLPSFGFPPASHDRVFPSVLATPYPTTGSSPYPAPDPVHFPVNGPSYPIGDPAYPFDAPVPLPPPLGVSMFSSSAVPYVFSSTAPVTSAAVTAPVVSPSVAPPAASALVSAPVASSSAAPVISSSPAPVAASPSAGVTRGVCEASITKPTRQVWEARLSDRLLDSGYLPPAESFRILVSTHLATRMRNNTSDWSNAWKAWVDLVEQAESSVFAKNSALNAAQVYGLVDKVCEKIASASKSTGSAAAVPPKGKAWWDGRPKNKSRVFAQPRGGGAGKNTPSRSK